MMSIMKQEDFLTKYPSLFFAEDHIKQEKLNVLLVLYVKENASSELYQWIDLIDLTNFMSLFYLQN